MVKPPKTPRPQKPPIQPPRIDQTVDITVSLIHEKLIGRIVITWSKLESCLEDFIWHLLDMNMDRGRIITTRLDVIAKIRMTRQFAELKLPETQFHTLSAILDKMDILREDRNFIVHGTWGRSMPENMHICLSLRPTPLAPDQAVSETFPETRLRAIIADIEQIKTGLLDLMFAIPTSCAERQELLRQSGWRRPQPEHPSSETEPSPLPRPSEEK